MLTNINVKSHFSNKDSLLKPIDIITFAKNQNFSHAFLCDVNYFGGALEFIRLSQKNKLIPVVGLEFIVVHQDIEYRILAYAKNYQGYLNLMRISSLIYNDHANKISYDNFNKLQDGLIIVLDLMSSNIYKDYLLNEQYSEQLALDLKLFNDFYYFITNYHLDQEFILSFRNSYDSNKEIIASSVRYFNSDDETTLKILNAIEDATKLEVDKISKSGTQFLKDLKYFEKHYTKEVIENTNAFISLFETFELPTKMSLPSYKESEELNNEYLKQLTYKGLIKRLQTNDPSQEYLDRLKYELSVVIKMGFANYFLVVYDYVLFAKKNNILVGPGRGSAAGSLIAYTLGITEVDPIKEQLLFERFLNPERVSLPDIDVDFQNNKREQIIDYLKEKYGYSHVAHIVTYGTFQAKNSISDVGRVMGVPEYRLNMIKKLIPNTLNVRLVDVLENSKQMQYLLQENQDLNYVYYHAIKLENIIRHMSTHAAGMIITDEKLTHYAPIVKEGDNTLIIQYDMNYLESIGLNKLDVLGLETLEILSGILNDIDHQIKLSDIPLNDPKTLKLMSSGKTLGIFQFESPGVIEVLKVMQVDSIDDMVATTALFRPGPMQFIQNYIARKHGQEMISYVTPSLKPILEATYGIIIYQEQIMQITQVMAGFSLAKADIVRKGMAKKDKQLLEEIEIDFVNEAIKRGYSEKVAKEVYEMILRFSDYGFNKAHAYSYALLGYYLAYLKVNYPKAFFRNVLSANQGKTEKIRQYSFEIKSYGLSLKVPDINLSTLKYEVVEDGFVLPLTSINGIGSGVANTIIQIRQKHQKPFVDYVDTVAWLSKEGLSNTIIEKLIYGGAFDNLNYSRKTMIENLDKVMQYIKIANLDNDQVALALDIIPKPTIMKYQDDQMIIDKEYESLGLYIKNNPFAKFDEKYQKLTLNQINVNKQAICMIDHIKEIRTKKGGKLMAFISVSDQVDSKTLVVFNNVYEKIKPLIKNKDVIIVEGYDDQQKVDNIIVNNIRVLSK